MLDRMSCQHISLDISPHVSYKSRDERKKGVTDMEDRYGFEPKKTDRPLRIYNGTAHDIHIIKDAEFDRDLRKWVGGEVVRVIPRNRPLNVHVVTTEIGDADGIPLFIKTAPEHMYLPWGFDIYIVSTPFAMIHGQTPEKNVFVVADTVVDKDTLRIRGCRGLQLFTAKYMDGYYGEHDNEV